MLITYIVISAYIQIIWVSKLILFLIFKRLRSLIILILLLEI